MPGKAGQTRAAGSISRAISRTRQLRGAQRRRRRRRRRKRRRRRRRRHARTRLHIGSRTR